jgi:hypothetical protein
VRKNRRVLIFKPQLAGQDCDGNHRASDALSIKQEVLFAFPCIDWTSPRQPILIYSSATKELENQQCGDQTSAAVSTLAAKTNNLGQSNPVRIGFPATAAG